MGTQGYFRVGTPGYSGVGHTRDHTLGGVGHSRGHSRDTLGLGTPGILRGWVSEFGTRGSQRCGGRQGRDRARSSC